MITLASLAILYGGGTGSGCHGPNCGRKPNKQTVIKQKLRGLENKQSPVRTKIQQNEKLLHQLKQDRIALKQSGDKVALRENAKARKWLREENDMLKHNMVSLQKEKTGYQKQRTDYLVKKVQDKNKAFGELTKMVHPNVPTSIDVQAPRRGQIVTHYKADAGHDITIIKPPKQYEKSGTAWTKKVSDQKGQYNKLLEEKTYNDNKEKTAFFVAHVALDKNSVVQVIRNFGQLRTTVKEIDLIGGNHIARTRIARFNNMGQASGFLNRRYGIRFNFKQ